MVLKPAPIPSRARSNRLHPHAFATSSWILMAITMSKARGHASAFVGTLFLLAILAITPARASEGTKLSGAALYNLYCASCHAVNLKGSDAPSLRDISQM